MSLQKPFYRIYRPNFIGGDNYVYQDNFANAYERQCSIRMYYILDEDIRKIFQFVEPGFKNNMKASSARINSLLLNTCSEVEKNCKKILYYNNYNNFKSAIDKKKGKVKDEEGLGAELRKNRWNIEDFKKVNKATNLSEYELSLKVGGNVDKKIIPFDEWTASEHSPVWWKQYNKIKHGLCDDQYCATLKECIASLAALHALLFAQFGEIALDPFGVRRPQGISSESKGTTMIRYLDTSSIFDIKPYRDWGVGEYAFKDVPDLEPQCFDFK